MSTHDEDALPPLLVSRKQTAALLACSVSSVLDLERKGVLRPVVFTDSRGAMVRYRLRNVERIAEGRGKSRRLKPVERNKRKRAEAEARE